MPTGEFSLREIPFSYPGSWFDVSPVVAQATYADDLHLVSHRHGMHAVLALVPESGGERAAVPAVATPSALTWGSGEERITAAFAAPDTLRIAGRGLAMRIRAAELTLTPFTGTYFFTDPVDGSAVFTSYETGHRYRVTVLSGHVRHVGAEALGTAERAVVVSGDAWEVAIEELPGAREPYSPAPAFDGVVAAARTGFTAFADAVAPWRGERTPAAELACYVLWSAIVAPAGFVGRPAVLMSKHWMDKVWSWDHCFNALALASGRPELAWDQVQVVFDHQDDRGALPDSITHAEVLRNFVKPPIHGWALSRLRGRLPGGLPETGLAYRQLAAWTTFWLEHRRVPGGRLAHYEHGNDSGWDNATPFAERRLVQTPDLAAFLVLQLKELAVLAAGQGDPGAAARWDAEAESMLASLLGELWDGTKFVSRSAATGAVQSGASLLELMPIVLGEHLPPDVRDKVVAGLEAHLTGVGLATEQPASAYYEPDGYWRGPVWAPVTVLIEDGLRRAGATELADRVSARFRAVCEKSGFAENFDALTGDGLRDRAYTWTAAAYLVLAGDAEDRLAQAR
ncbi:trehalase family glycosidase [Amycolatopsis sp. DG1A-15b]|uniref:MGH1-like glycoside hydrolase domain-containing protein n=1 Tax=Amycolatopsis sp. DG1A-15b TaxID=3052846 RepID=UPI00255B5C7F|nr:trehalase family glycosidase [Amycolatopsis sp. DG1A-15b]WIX89825.1 trehalase family glycosidase [Amycolatopsis sp. DG1A-15b]